MEGLDSASNFVLFVLALGFLRNKTDRDKNCTENLQHSGLHVISLVSLVFGPELLKCVWQCLVHESFVS